MDYRDGENSLDVEYEYEVDGEHYVRRRIGYMLSHAARASVAARLKDGAAVDVFYDPAALARAVLVRDPSTEWVGLLVFGALFPGIVALRLTGSGSIRRDRSPR